MWTRRFLTALLLFVAAAPILADDTPPAAKPVEKSPEPPRRDGETDAKGADSSVRAPASADASADASAGTEGTTTVSVPTFMNATCPIMGKPASALLFADVAKGRIYLCCAPCAKKVKQDPERAYEAAYPTTRRAGNTVCPVTGSPLGEGSPTVVLQGIEVGVASHEVKEAAARMAQSILAKANDPLVKEVGNTTCPITGEAVAGDAFCLIGKSLVRLSAPRCVEGVAKDPAKALERARLLVPKAGAGADTPADSNTKPEGSRSGAGAEGK